MRDSAGAAKFRDWPEGRDWASIEPMLRASRRACFIALALVACPTPRRDGPALPPAARAEPARAEQVWRAIATVDGAALWPGFDPPHTPLAVHDGARTWLFGHPNPPARFTRSSDGVAFVEGRDDIVAANYLVDVDGITTATMSMDDDMEVLDATALAVHEQFHVFQRAHFAGWVADETAAFDYPVADPIVLGLRILELEALARATRAKPLDDATAQARRALALRATRFSAMPPRAVEYERKTELVEGLARYLQGRVEGRTEPDWPTAGFAADDVRARAYAIGDALALLLDRMAPQWKQELAREPDLPLDALLERHIGRAQLAPAAKDGELARVRPEVDRRLAELEASRARLAKEHASAPGWTVLVEPGKQRLGVASFDPMNIAQLGEGRMLHTRMLELVGECTRLRVSGLATMTVGPEHDPLTGPFTELRITGLAEPPVVGGEQPRIELRTPELEATFCGAELRRDDARATIVVRLRE